MLNHKRLVYKFPWQSATHIEVDSDTNWAGCPRTRKSTSGGAGANPAPTAAHGATTSHRANEPISFDASCVAKGCPIRTTDRWAENVGAEVKRWVF